MEKVNLLALGSIVVVSGGIKKLMIISRAINVPLDGAQKYFDYGACPYPEGLVGDQGIYFNHAQIAKVIFEGFSDDDNKLMLDAINEAMTRTPADVPQTNISHNAASNITNINNL